MEESDTGAETAADLPKVWYSRILQSTDVSVDLKNHFSNKEDILPYIRKFRLFELVPLEKSPKSIYYAKNRVRIPDRYGHAFKIWNGLLVISPKLRDVLIQFDLGRTALFEVPILQADGETPSDYPPQ